MKIYTVYIYDGTPVSANLGLKDTPCTFSEKQKLHQTLEGRSHLNLSEELDVFASTHLKFYRTKRIHLFFSRLLPRVSAPHIDRSVCHLSSEREKHTNIIH